MGHLASIYLEQRRSRELLTYEIIYFLHQMPKLPNAILLQIINNVSEVLKGHGLNLNSQDPSIYKDNAYFPDFISGMMLTIICYCFLGDSDIAYLFSQRLVRIIPFLPHLFTYLKVHSYYWAARSYAAESDKKGAQDLLLKAKKFKKYEFNIDSKIDRVLSDLKKGKL